MTTPGGKPRSAHLLRVLSEELGGSDFRLTLASFLVRLFPMGSAGRIRAGIYRAAGINIGPRTLIAGPLPLSGVGRVRANLRVGAGCFINTHVFIDATGPVTLGDGVSLGHHVVIITSHHAFGPPEFRAGMVQPGPVTIESGAWIAAGVTLLPGVTIGSGAVVAAGAVVPADVPPNCLVGGIPAKLIRTLEA